jgi:hypothetical protein
MRNRKLYWSLTLVLAVLGFSFGTLAGNNLDAHSDVDVQLSTRAVWKEVYQTPAQMAARADAVVLARVAGVQPGRVAFSASGEDALPFQVVELDVVRAFKGARTGDRISLERAGGTAPDGRAVHLDFDGGDFEAGATYLLFLKRQEAGPFYYQVNHQGRYLEAEGRLWAVDPDDPVAKSFEGRPVAQGLRLVERVTPSTSRQ